MELIFKDEELVVCFSTPLLAQFAVLIIEYWYNIIQYRTPIPLWRRSLQKGIMSLSRMGSCHRQHPLRWLRKLHWMDGVAWFPSYCLARKFVLPCLSGGWTSNNILEEMNWTLFLEYSANIFNGTPRDDGKVCVALETEEWSTSKGKYNEEADDFN